MISFFTALPDSAFVFLRREVLDGECDYFGDIHVKYFLSGQQLVSIDFPAVDVHADKDYVTKGTSVRFTAVPVDFTPGGSRTWDWSWRTPTSSFFVSACTGQTICDYVPQQSGDMLVQGPHAPVLTVGGISDTVDVLNCPTADTLLNNPIVRKALRRALDSSYADSTTAKRRERIGFVYYDTTANQIPSLRVSTYDAPSYSLSNACRAETSGPPVQPPFVLVAYYHTHPFSSGTNTTPADIKPTNCGPQHAGRFYRTGPSPDDWQTALGLGVVGYIIDKNEVFKFDATHPSATNPSLRRSLVRQWPWNTAQCAW